MRVKCADIKVGIWDTVIVLRVYKDKAVLSLPYVSWDGNNGSLATEKYSVKNPEQIEKLSRLFGDYDVNPSGLRDYLRLNFGY